MQTIELAYLYADGTGVSGARYHVSGEFSAEGVLSADGRTQIAGVPASVRSYTRSPPPPPS